MGLHKDDMSICKALNIFYSKALAGIPKIKLWVPFLTKACINWIQTTAKEQEQADM